MSRWGVALWPSSLPGQLAVVVLGATVIRLIALGGRVAHWDEARIAFWVLQYAETGSWTYHPVFHGPLLFHVERAVFGVLGPTDFSMRLFPAMVGSVLPASAWLFRDRLEETEVLAMAGLLALNPILVYFSRFMRNDILVAAFSLVTLGFVLRGFATGRRRYAVGAGVAFGAALGSKENAILYVLAWIGAVLLLAGWRYWKERIRPTAPSVATLARYSSHWVLGLTSFLVTMVVIYAPRGSGPESLGSLRRAVNDPAVVRPVLEAGLVSPAVEAIHFWALGSAQGEYPYHVFVGLLVGLLVVGAAATIVLAAVGLRRHEGRSVVMFAGFWAGLSVVGYPAAADLMAGWIALHVVVPSTIPAAVGLAHLTAKTEGLADSRFPTRPDWLPGPSNARSSGPWSDWLPNRRPVLALLAAYLLLTVALTSFVVPGSLYNPIGQPSQMGPAAGESIEAVEARIDGPGPHVAYVGPYWESHIHRLPLLWYVERAEGDRLFVGNVSELGEEPPPVVVTHDSRSEAIRTAYPDYECRANERVPWEGGRPSGLPGEMLICVTEDPDRDG